MRTVIFLFCIFCCIEAHASDTEPIVIRTIIMEAVGAGEIAMQGVSEVIRNRVSDRRWPDNPLDVVIQPWQFSPNNGNREKNWKSFVRRNEIDGGDWRRALKAWKKSSVSNITNGANHFYATWIKPPSWSRKMKVTTKIENIVFLKG